MAIPAAILPLSDGIRTRLAPPAPPPRSREEQTTDQGALADIFYDRPLALHKRAVRALWDVKQEEADGLHQRLRHLDGQAKNLRRSEIVKLAAHCGLAVSHLCEDDRWGIKVWPLLERAARGQKLTKKEREALAAATAHLEMPDMELGELAFHERRDSYYAHDAIFRAARGQQSTTDAAVIALRRPANRERMLDLIVDIAEMTSR